MNDWEQWAKELEPDYPKTAEIHVEYFNGQSRVIQDNLSVNNGTSDKDMQIRYMSIKAAVDTWYTEYRHDKTIVRFYSTYNKDYLYSRKLSHDSPGKYLGQS